MYKSCTSYIYTARAWCAYNVFLTFHLRGVHLQSTCISESLHTKHTTVLLRVLWSNDFKLPSSDVKKQQRSLMLLIHHSVLAVKNDQFSTVEAIYSENINTCEIRRLELCMLWRELGRADFYANWSRGPPVCWLSLDKRPCLRYRFFLR